MKEPTNELDKNAVSIVCTNSHCKEEVVGQVQQKSMIVSIFLYLSHCAWDIFATGKHVNHGGEYGREIPPIFHFLGLKKPLNSPKKIIQVEENLN